MALKLRSINRIDQITEKNRDETKKNYQMSKKMHALQTVMEHNMETRSLISEIEIVINLQ